MGSHPAERSSAHEVTYLPVKGLTRHGRLLHVASSGSGRPRPGDLTDPVAMPLRGVSELTVLRAGQLEHRDSLGNRGVLDGPGARLVAGGGGLLTECGASRDIRREGGQLDWISVRWAQPVPGAVPTTRLVGAPAPWRQGRSTITRWSGPRTALPDGPSVQLVHIPSGGGVDLAVEGSSTATLVVLAGEVLVGADLVSVTAPSIAELAQGGERVQLVTHLDAAPATVLVVALPGPTGEWVHRDGLLVASTAEELADVQQHARSGSFGTLPRMDG